MERTEFISYLRDHNKTYEYQLGEMEGVLGIYVKNNEFNTETFISEAAIEKSEIDEILKSTHQGKNIENITRVTGFFSKTKGWNKGKTGELKQRHRSEV
ncbi:MAG: anaerobic ribonucleoside-triphosphate reductase [Candidatus Thermoplasmatota archaeon]|nr:anaerobic ribonucleoside-triphosphate reductase [Candidatus Thermoplasmatota archaeon]